jgi:6-pyruvoyltetrahydropterin/6-carboxytetrahydropterin synthase
VVRLTRAVRFAINPSAEGSDIGPNGYAASPSIQGLGRHYELDVACVGDIDPTTSYLIDIKAIDKAVRDKALPIIQRACLSQNTNAQEVLTEVLAALKATLGARLEGVRWRLSPYYSVEMTASSEAKPPAFSATTALLRQRFDFAAAHRLHLPNLSPEQNQALFGKCNNPTGHGHNYQFEPSVEVSATRGTPSFTLQDLERLSQSTIIERFDHKHLNQDTAEFDLTKGGVNPTVENIARVFYELLSKAIATKGKGAKLRAMTVWETDRTSATYPA